MINGHSIIGVQNEHMICYLVFTPEFKNSSTRSVGEDRNKSYRLFSLILSYLMTVTGSVPPETLDAF